MGRGGDSGSVSVVAGVVVVRGRWEDFEVVAWSTYIFLEKKTKKR